MLLKTAAGEGFVIHERGLVTAERGILILHDWWGIKPYNLDWAERFAALGYRAIVADLYDEYNPKDTQEAGEMMRTLDQERADRKLHAALTYLMSMQQRIAVLGWSFGGLQAQHATYLEPQSISATVFYYCRILDDPQLIASLQGAVLGIFSETERTWPEKQQKWESAMAAAGKTYESHSYAADHGFVNPESPRFDAEVTAQSWQRVVEFLDRHLG